jgi:hypothetical protein
VIDAILGRAAEHAKFGLKAPLSRLREAIGKLPWLGVNAR